MFFPPKKLMDTHTDLKTVQKSLIMSILDLAMTNYVWHEGSHYQIKGVAMGAKYDPSVANLLLSQWEVLAVYKAHIPEITYKRYMDDIVILWNGSMEKLIEFLTKINSNKFGLKFTAT